MSDLLFFFRSWLVVCLSEEAVGWLSIRRFRSLLLICSTGRSGIFNTLFLMVKDCKPASFGGFLQPMFFKWVLDLVICGEWLFRSSKPCLTRVFAGVLFLCCLHVQYYLQTSVGSGRSKEEDDRFGF